MRDNPVHPVLCSFGRIRDSPKVTFRTGKIIGAFAYGAAVKEWHVSFDALGVEDAGRQAAAGGKIWHQAGEKARENYAVNRNYLPILA